MLTVLTGDAIEQLRTLPDESVQCCVTSPPYWGLRDYGTAAWEGGDEGCDHKDANQVRGNIPGTKQATNNHGEGGASYRNNCGKCRAHRTDSQLGLEKTPEEYVSKMVEVFREVRRVLRKDGTLWLNLGDSYAGSGKGGNPEDSPHDKQRTNRGTLVARKGDRANNAGLKPKDLVGIPWRVAFALQADGWWLRSDIIWAKPNPMPESVTDRCTKSHEYIFMLTKSANYFWDAEAIKELSIWADDPRADQGHIDYDGKRNGMNGQGQRAFVSINSAGRNKRSVWNIATSPYADAHFATFSPEIPKICIMAGTSAKGCCAKCGAPWERVVEKETNTELRNLAGKNNDTYQRGRVTPRGSPIGDFHDLGTVSSKTLGWQPTCKCDAGIQPCVILDPFAGSGTTGMVALELGRKAVLIELNPKYCELIRQRCDVTLGLQLA